MQATLRQDVVRTLFHAQPVDPSDLNEPTETELTRAARQSISNADKIVDVDNEFEAADFAAAKKSEGVKKVQTTQARKKAKKAERQRKTKARKHK